MSPLPPAALLALTLVSCAARGPDAGPGSDLPRLRPWLTTSDGLVTAPQLQRRTWACLWRRTEDPIGGWRATFIHCGPHDQALLLTAESRPASPGETSPEQLGWSTLLPLHASDRSDAAVVSTRSVLHQGRRGAEITFAMTDAVAGPYRIIDRIWIEDGVVLRMSVRGGAGVLTAQRDVIEQWFAGVRFAPASR